jgi:hypothetical protein
MDIAFHWVRDLEKRFKLRTHEGVRVVGHTTPRDFQAMTVYSPLQPKADRPALSAEAREIILALANVQSEAEALAFVNYYGPLTAAGRHTLREPISAIEDAAEKFRDMIEALIDSEANAAIQADHHILEFDFGSLRTELSPEGGKWALNLRVPDLLGALKFMMAKKLAAGGAFKRCPLCKKLFDVGEGTGRTVAAVYCSKQCQIKNKRMGE